MSEMLSVADVARIVGLSEYTIREAVRACELRATKLRGRIRVHPDDLAAWIDTGRIATTSHIDDALAASSIMPTARQAPAGSFKDAVRARRAA